MVVAGYCTDEDRRYGNEAWEGSDREKDDKNPCTLPTKQSPGHLVATLDQCFPDCLQRVFTSFA